MHVLLLNCVNDNFYHKYLLYDLLVKNAPWSRSWCDTLETASTAFGKTLNVGRFHRRWMEEAGFVDVEEKVVKVSTYLQSIES